MKKVFKLLKKIALGCLIIFAVNGALMPYNNSFADEKAAEEIYGCAPIKYYEEMTDSDDCMFCPLFATVFNAVSSIALHSATVFPDSIKKVVIIAFAIWIAFQALAFVSSPEVRDFKDFASALITQGFVVMMVVIILDAGVIKFFNSFLNPVYQTGQTVAQAIITPDKLVKKTQASISDGSGPAAEIQKKFKEDGLNSSNLISEKGGLPASMGKTILQTMTLIQNRVAQIKALGNASICTSWEKNVAFIPHLNYLFVGIGLWVGAMVMLLAIPFMMVDAVFELGVVFALLPFAVGCYAFKITRGYTKKVWETLLNSIFKFVFVSLTALMVVLAYQSILSKAGADLSELFQGPDATKMSLLLKELPWFGTEFLELCFVMILSWTVLSSVSDFAGEFASSISETSIGSSIGTMAGSFSKSAALRIGKPIGKSATKHTWNGIKTVARAPTHYGRQMILNHQANTIQNKGKQNEDGSYTYKKGDSTYTLTVKPDGSKTVKKAEQSFDKKNKVMLKKIKIKNTNFSITTQEFKDKNGNSYYKDDIKLNNSLTRKLLNKDGSLNGKVYESMLLKQGSEENDKLNIALAKQLMQTRMEKSGFDFKESKYTKQVAKYDAKGNFIGYDEVGTDGSIKMIRLELGKADEKGRQQIKTTFSNIDKKGKGITLETDGIINKRTDFKTYDQSKEYDPNKNNVDEYMDKSTAKSQIILDRYHQDLWDKSGKGTVKKHLQNTMFEKEEVETALENSDDENSFVRINVTRYF